MKDSTVCFLKFWLILSKLQSLEIKIKCHAFVKQTAHTRPIYTTENLGTDSWKSGTDRIVLAVYMDNNYHGSDGKWAEDQVWTIAFTLHILGNRIQ